MLMRLHCTWPFVSLLALLLAATSLRGDAPAAWFTRTWQTDEGLPDNAVVGIAQTAEGFLWVATQGGLVRFDGNQFRDFAPVADAEVPSGLLHGLMVDRRDRLWVAKDGGVIACVTQGRTRSYLLRRGSQNARAVKPVEDGEGSIWASYPALPSRVVKIRDGEVSYFGAEEGLPPGSVVQLASDAAGKLWFAAGEKLGVYRGGKFVPLITVDGVQCLAGARGGGVWAGARSRVMRFAEDGGLAVVGEIPVDRANVSATVVFEDRVGRLWVGTSGHGLFRREGAGFVNVATSHREILSLADDREGNLWVGTRGGGLDRVRPSVLEVQEIASGLSSEAVRSVCQDRDGVLWAVARSGVVARHHGGRWSVIGVTNGWSVNDAMSVAPDPGGGIWIGTHFNGVFLWRDGVVTSFTMADGLAGNFARSLLTGTNGDLWIGTASAEGLHRLRAGRLQRFQLPPGSGLIRSMAMDSTGRLWAGTAGGMLISVTGEALADETAGAVPRLQTIRCLHTSADGSLWIGYGGSGVGRLKGGVFTQFRAEQGISDDYISLIHDDAGGRVWFAGNKGIFCVAWREFDDLVAGRIARVRPVLFGREEGLPALQASREAWPGISGSRDGRIFVCMQTGLAVVHPESMRNVPVVPVLIESVAVDGHEVAAYDAATVRSGSTNLANALVALRSPKVGALYVAPGSEQVAIEFTAPSFALPRNLAFRFKLEGLETDWVEAGARRVAYYSHLPPGNYRFRVTASDFNGGWSEFGAVLDIKVLPRFWQTWWFRVLAALSLVAAVGGVVRFLEMRGMRLQLERAEREQAVERERARIAKDIHDDLGASLTEITLLSELAQGGVGSPEEFQADMRKIASRTRDLTRSLDATVWAVNPRNDSLESLVTYTCSQAEDFLKAAGIRCRMELPERLPAETVAATTRHNVFLIVKEALHNVVKHAVASEVAFRIATDGNRMVLSIEDNGQGFQPESATREDAVLVPRRGNGIANMKVRADAIGGRFELHSCLGGGTRIQVEVRFGDQ